MADNTSLLCEEKHKNIDKKLAEHEVQIDNNTEDINALKNSTIRTETVVNQLCKQIQDLVIEMKEQRQASTTRVLAIAGAALLITVGFIVWYIQSLPR